MLINGAVLIVVVTTVSSVDILIHIFLRFHAGIMMIIPVKRTSHKFSSLLCYVFILPHFAVKVNTTKCGRLEYFFQEEL